MMALRSLGGLRTAAVLSSLLFSAVAVMLGQFPNDDAYVYLRTAEIFREDGIVAAFRHYPWATAPVLIGLLETLPGLDAFGAAQLLNALWYAVVTAGFITLVQQFDDSRRVGILAALTVLAFPLLNEFRFYVIRDIAFVGLSLWAAVYFLRYYAAGRWQRAATYCALLVAAALFRAEALVFLALVPLSLLAHPALSIRQRLRRLCLVWGLAALVPVAALLAFTVAGIDLREQLRDAVLVYQPFVQQWLAQAGGDNPALTQALFNEHAARFSDDYTGLIVNTGLLAMLGARLLESLGIAPVVLLAWGLYRRPVRPDWPALRPWLGWVLVSLAILIGFTLLTRFVTTRYTLLFCLLVLVLLPLLVDGLWEQARSTGRLRRFGWITGLLLAFSAVDSHISYGEPETWQPAALQWLDLHTNDATPLRTNHRYIAWRSGKIDNYDEVERRVPAEYFLDAPSGTVLVVERAPGLLDAMERAVEQGQLDEQARFTDRRGARIVVYLRL